MRCCCRSSCLIPDAFTKKCSGIKWPDRCSQKRGEKIPAVCYNGDSVRVYRRKLLMKHVSLTEIYVKLSFQEAPYVITIHFRKFGQRKIPLPLSEYNRGFHALYAEELPVSCAGAFPHAHAAGSLPSSSAWRDH